MRKFLLLLFLSCLGMVAQTQQISLSKQAEISILTIGPGEQLYDSFGHSAFRVKDPTINLDVVYNYGTYDFKTPNFYLKFAQGKLLYQLAYNNYTPFYSYYSRQDRWIKEQILDLTNDEKQAIFSFLQNNAEPENKDYLYDFLYDNCATKIRDVMVDVLGERIQYSDSYITQRSTFRQLIQKNVYWNSWGSLGMDVAIGAVVDRKASAWEYQFLPEYVFEASAIAKLNSNKRLVKSSHDIYKSKAARENGSFFISPLFVFGLIGLFIMYITYNDYKNNTRNNILDASIYIITGLIGIGILLLWFATEHSTTANNYNLLWAFPLSLLFLNAALKENPGPGLRKFVIFQILLFTLMGIHWVTGVQVFALALLPLFIALMIRYIYLVAYLPK